LYPHGVSQRRRSAHVEFHTIALKTHDYPSFQYSACPTRIKASKCNKEITYDTSKGTIRRRACSSQEEKESQVDFDVDHLQFSYDCTKFVVYDSCLRRVCFGHHIDITKPKCFANTSHVSGGDLVRFSNLCISF
jgi:hypothetical protein